MAVARQLALDVRIAVVGHPIGWCDLERISLAGGFRTKRSHFSRDSKSRHSALLVPRIDGSFDVLVDAVSRIPGKGVIPRLGQRGTATDVHRFRFRVAHEIGHSFFYNRHARPPTRLLPFSKEEERFCDEFASALLIPPPDVASYPADTSSVFEIQKRYQVSVQAAAHSLARAHPTVFILGLLRYRHPRTGRIGDRVLWSHGPGFVPNEARLESIAVDKATAGCKASIVERLNLGALRGPYHVVAECPAARKLTVVIAAKDDRPYAGPPYPPGRASKLRASTHDTDAADR